MTTEHKITVVVIAKGKLDGSTAGRVSRKIPLHKQVGLKESLFLFLFNIYKERE